MITTTATSFFQVSAVAFRAALAGAQDTSATVAGSTTPAADLDLSGAACYVADDLCSGYVVKANGELISVFSLIKGRGNAIMADALRNGASHLDCFDGYLPTLYARFGFREVTREPNWTAGGPDVVYMALVREPAPASHDLAA